MQLFISYLMLTNLLLLSAVLAQGIFGPYIQATLATVLVFTYSLYRIRRDHVKPAEKIAVS